MGFTTKLMQLKDSHLDEQHNIFHTSLEICVKPIQYCPEHQEKLLECHRKKNWSWESESGKIEENQLFVDMGQVS